MTRPRYSIRYKILTVVTAILAVAILLYLLLATKIFRQDKTELVFELNNSVVKTISTEVETALRGANDKLRLYALLFAGNQNSNSSSLSAFRDVITDDPLLVKLELHEQTSSGAMNRVAQIGDEHFAKLYGIDEKFFSEVLLKQKPVPYDTIKASANAVWNATIEKGPALIGMGISVIREGAKGVPEKILVVVGYLKADLFLKNLKSSNMSQAFIVGADGHVLIHPKPEIMIKSPDFSDSPIVAELKKGTFNNGVMQFEDQAGAQMGAYSKIKFGGLGVVSQVASRKAFVAVQSLIVRSALFAMIILTLTFIATVFFSRSLTRPIHRLMWAMERVAQGNMDTELKFKTHDEIEVLSKSFNKMTLDLKSSRAELRETNRDLELKVIDRTKKLEEQNRAVKEAQEALLRTTRLASVGEIAGRTAHEVLNPLTSLMARIQRVQSRLSEEILSHKNVLGEIVGAWRGDLEKNGVDGFLNNLKKPSNVDAKISLLQEDVGNITEIFGHWDKDMNLLTNDTQFLLQQARRIEKILNQMRSLSTISSVRRTKLKGNPILHDALNIVADLFAKNRIQTFENYNAKIDEIKVDRDELIQVLTNLLRNSLHAVLEAGLEKGHGFVRIESFNEEKKLCIDIVDNGIGISQENQTKLFENQFTTKSPDLGTGLGLSISRRFVRAFNGDLFLVKSEAQKETRFRIELPLDLDEKAGVAA